MKQQNQNKKRYFDSFFIIINKQSKRLRSFVEENGNGPFEKIYPLSFTGELQKPAILVKKVMKREYYNSLFLML